MAFVWRNDTVVAPGCDRRACWRTRATVPRPADAYRRRHVVERCVGRLKQFRGIATRYEKRAANFRAMVVIASIVIWLGS